MKAEAKDYHQKIRKEKEESAGGESAKLLKQKDEEIAALKAQAEKDKAKQNISAKPLWKNQNQRGKRNEFINKRLEFYTHRSRPCLGCGLRPRMVCLE